MDVADALQKTLNDNIPLTTAIGAIVESYDGQQLKISSPLAPNINHKQTAFGGSLYCAAVLSAWGLLYIKLIEASEEGQIVIFDGSVHYEKPVTGCFSAQCELGSEDVWERFLKTYRRMGKARLTLESDVFCGNDLCVSFKGQFVVERET